MTTKQKIVGTYDLGGEAVTLVLRDGLGGDFWIDRRPPHRIVRIFIGADQDQWRGILVNLVHEVKELCDLHMGCEFSPDIAYGGDAANRLFVETHTQHAEICARLGYFLAECLPDLERAWKQWKKETKK